jgi:predicted fused transcriptional regulator/phosphomethylpyrimidine kinase
LAQSGAVPGSNGNRGSPMSKKLKTKEQTQSDMELLRGAEVHLKQALGMFYKEYYDWECTYSRIGIKYYEELEEAYEKLDFSTKRYDKKYVGSGEKMDWETTTHVNAYDHPLI